MLIKLEITFQNDQRTCLFKTDQHSLYERLMTIMALHKLKVISYEDIITQDPVRTILRIRKERI